MKFQKLASVISISLALGLATSALAADRPDASPSSGFYGGVAYRPNAPGGLGLDFGTAGAPLNPYAAAAADETSARALVFGGFRWRNDLAVEASVSSVDKYALRPLELAGPPGGVGLRFGPGAGDVQSRTYNVDVITSWTVYKSVALFGRLGYAQTEALATAGTAAATAGARGIRDGINYGVGVRYDMNQALGLRVEYSRFGLGRFAGEFGSGLPDSDQVTVGVQFRF